MNINKIEFRKLAETYIAKWDCTADGEIFFTHSSVLWPVKRNAQSLMLKITNPEDDEAHAAEFINAFDGHGIVKLYEYDENKMLLDRLQNEKGSLDRLVYKGEDDTATHIVCDVIDRLHKWSPQKKEIPFLTNFQDRFETMIGYVNKGNVPDKYKPDFKYVYKLIFELSDQIKDTFRALHGDIHHFNILESDTGEWLSVDPKGFWGPKVYEYATALCTPPLYSHIVENDYIIRRRLQIMSERSGIEEKLIATFGFLHVMQVAAWCSWSKQDQDFWLESSRIAAKLANIKLSSD